MMKTLIDSRPEVALLGKVLRVIERTGLKTVPSVVEVPFRKTINPAYDLDE